MQRSLNGLRTDGPPVGCSPAAVDGSPRTGQLYVAVDGYRDKVGTCAITIAEGRPGQTSVASN